MAPRKRLRQDLQRLTAPQLAEFVASLPEPALLPFLYDWEGVWARDSQLLPDNDWWSTWLVCAGRSFGKLIDAETPVPTPQGWTRLADIRVGDQVFDESGRICRVTKTFDDVPDVAYRLRFSDGTHIDACGDHQWVTWSNAERKAFLRSPYEDTRRFPQEWPAWRLRRAVGRGKPKPKTYPDSPGPQIRTTQRIVDTFRYGKRNDLNHCIPLCGALQTRHRKLPLDPYVLGLWLGDGSTGQGIFTAHEDDQAHLRMTLEDGGFRTTVAGPGYPQRVGTLGLAVVLRSLGVLHDKHVPPAYLRGSPKQRLALLQGLMDTDGCSDPHGHVEFCNTNERLAMAVVELARSLGEKPTVIVGRSRLYGVDKGPKWRVSWTATTPVFRMPRKLALLKPERSSKNLMLHHRMIVSAERIASVPMRCLTVDSRHSMFLVGEGMIPTHNTHCGAEAIIQVQREGVAGRIALVAPTSADARDVMIEGKSGLITLAPPWNKPKYEPSKRRVTWKNGARAFLYSAEEPERLRGPQHDFAWCDEIAAWVDGKAVWNQLQFGMRVGDRPRVIATTTPKNVPLVLDLLKDPKTFVTRGSTFENTSLPQSYLDTMHRLYDGTRLGRQEISAEVLEDNPGALYSQALIDKFRVSTPPPTTRRVISIDPAPTSDRGSDETGIMAVGCDERGHGYVLRDHSLRGSPNEWASAAIKAYYTHGADMIVAEINNGGEMVEAVLRSVDDRIPFKAVRAMKGKSKRAEPIAALYEQGKIHHCGTAEDFERLERQMRVFTGQNGKRDDRTDAMNWGFHELLVGDGDFAFV